MSGLALRERRHALPSKKTHRRGNLDLARSIAITAVVVYHCIQWLGQENQFISTYYRIGAYGVELFFALSGYLIGSLYWRELQATGDVNKLRFIARRALRTMPPYFAVLPVAFIGVYVTRDQAFDWRYLFFLQNYSDEMPFFLVSWSLCIEEHFYLGLPFILALIVRLGHASIGWSLLLVAMVPACLRALEANSESMNFGYSTTATHLRFDSLLFGVLAAYLARTSLKNYSPGATARWVTGVSLLTLLSIEPHLPRELMYVFGYLALAVLFAALVLIWDASPTFTLSRLAANKAIALTSYSTYLTHAIAIHVALVIVAALSIESEAVKRVCRTRCGKFHHAARSLDGLNGLLGSSSWPFSR